MDGERPPRGDQVPARRYQTLFNGYDTAADAERVFARYGRLELQHAFLDEPECRHVIQQFVIDG